MKYLVGILTIFLFSGCSLKDTALDTAKQYAKDNNLTDFVTFGCVDVWDKKKCPSRLLEIDLGIPYTPMTARTCLGFDNRFTSIPKGMYCIRYNITDKF